MRPGSGLVALLLASVLSAPVHAQPARQLEDARALASTGAADLALERIERAQPRQASDPGWTEWEALRLDLLLVRHRYADVLKRYEAHASESGTAAARVRLANLAARAALGLGRFDEARRLLLSAFLVAEAAPDDYRAARYTAIETYLEEKLFDAAYLGMLRFRQDFTPLAPAEVEHFVGALIDADRIDEAAGWLAQLPPGSPNGVLLRMRAGLMAPAAAAKQARELIAKGETEAGWRLLAAAGRALADPAIELEVLEQRLDVRDASAAAQSDLRAALWKAYFEVAERAANDARLLAGDDASWIATAERLRSQRSSAARALVAAMSMRAQSAEVRAKAQLLLLAWLRDAALERSAWRLLADAERFPVAELDARVRRELGELAALSGDPAMGLRYWDGLPPADGMTPQQWHARNLALMLQAGLVTQAASQAASALDPRTRLDAETVRRLLLAAADARELGHTAAARTVLQGLAAHADDAQRMEVMTALARTYEAEEEHRAAAEAYLLAAAAAPKPSEAAAVAAREAAVSSLLRAGLHADARAVLAWIARNAQSAESRKAAERRLSRM